MKILADASLPGLSALFASPCTLTTYTTTAQLHGLLATHEVLICRSTLKIDQQLLAGTPISCVASASSGIDHIDSDYLQRQGITLFDAKGCNAASVADYVVATVALLQQQKILIGIKAGVIGYGEVGRRVAARLRAAGFEVVCFDPLRALEDNSQPYCVLGDLLRCDLLSIHANLHETLPFPSKNLLDKAFLRQLKQGITIINAARGGIVNEQALLQAPQLITYCTDVYAHEPAIAAPVVAFSTLCTPHIAGHSIESKYAAVVQLSQKIHDHYKIPMPTLTAAEKTYPLPAQANWQDYVLAIYNPLVETQHLKAAVDKKHAFLALRQAHSNRHDFIRYDASQLEPQARILLGQNPSSEF